MGQKQKKREKKKRKEDCTMVITMAKLRMAHSSTHGARKPPGPKEEEERKSVKTMASFASTEVSGTNLV